MYSLFASLLFLSIVLLCQVNSQDVQCLATIKYNEMNKTKTIFHDLQEYKDATCAQCFHFLVGIPKYWKNSSVLMPYTTITYKPNVQMSFLINETGEYHWEPHVFKYSKLDFQNKDDWYLRQFKNDQQMEIFLRCCSDAINCCEHIQSSENVDGSKNCPAEWDSFSCWHSAEAGTTEFSLCPDMVYQREARLPTSCIRDYASKECNANGTWFFYYPNISGTLKFREYVNYDKCLSFGELQRYKESNLYIAGYSISLTFTLIGSIIFLAYKQHKSLRIRIHLNFFLSLILNCICSIAFFSQENLNTGKTCKAITVVHKSAHLANYCWMLIEGVYLHQLIATMAAVKGKRNARYYYIFGWGTTPIVMTAYICVHSMQKYDNTCWMQYQDAPDIIWETVPLFCIAANFLLLANIIRVLFTKLSSTPEHLRSGLKATLALVPIYGIQYLFYVIPFDPLESCSTGLFALKYIEIFVASFQGAIITTIFCFTNREVHLNIKRSFRQRFPKKDTTEMVTEEQGFEASLS